jgi:hypothetical protein
MTSFVSNAGAAHVLAVLFGRTETALPNYFVALCQRLPQISDAGTTLAEPGPSNGYQRVMLPNYATSWTLSGYNEAVNAIDLVWPTVTDDWGKLTSFAITDSQEVGTGRLLISGLLSPPLQPQLLTQLRVRAGQLVINASSMTPSYQPT